MTSTIDRAAEPSSARAPAQRLASICAAVRVSFTWLGVRKTLSRDQKDQAAESFGAEGTFLSAAKKLLDTRDPSYRSVTSIRNRTVSYWRALTLPFPEPGIRLLRQDRVEAFDQQMQQFREELTGAVADLNSNYEQLKQRARERLGRLFCADDYPLDLNQMFALQWDYPSIDAPDYLLQLNPKLYEQEKARIAARFEEAVELAEQAFAAEFSKLLEHLTERLSGGGKSKVFRDSAVNNLKEFFDRFRQLNIRSNPQLDELVENAQAIVKGVSPQDLRETKSLRQQIQAQLSTVQSTLDQLMVDQPRRRILRGPASAAGEGGA
jgi:hypothetical protein